jgi:nitroimidazol reductase NimA-like FMN-containing flavoprotein (pyridoxamine 5'-phosphate oxidase superfamily)
MSIDYSPDKAPKNQILRQKYACDDEWTRAFLIRCQVGHVATHWDDQPFITPVLYWYDPAKNKIYFHTNTHGRLMANYERENKVCFEACEAGKIFPSNIALGFSMQYESAVVFGKLDLVEDRQEKMDALYGLIRKHFSDMEPGDHYRPITESELTRTAVFAITVESWSGKRNWREKASQNPDWKPLEAESAKGKPLS